MLFSLQNTGETVYHGNSQIFKEQTDEFDKINNKTAIKQHKTKIKVEISFGKLFPCYFYKKKDQCASLQLIYSDAPNTRTSREFASTFSYNGVLTPQA